MSSPRTFLAAAIGLSACAPATSTETERPRAPRPVRLETVSRYVPSDAAVFPARVRAERQPDLSFRIPGRITQVLVDVGDAVEPGARLASLDPSDFRTRVADATAAVAQAEAEATRTQRTAARAERLFKGNAVSEAERDQARDVARSAQARLESTRQRLTLARRELEYTRLVASDRGVVVERLSDPGANVQAGQAILRVSGDNLEVRTDIPESALLDAAAGAAAEVRIPALGPGFRPATVVRVAKSAVGRSVLYPVFLRLADPPPRLVPGLAAEVRFPPREGSDGGLLAVSPSAVVGDPDGPFVWVLAPLGEANGEEGIWVARRRGITLARLTDRAALVSKGLTAGEKVATAGVNYLSEGRRVRPARLAPLVFEGVHTPSPAPAVEAPAGGDAR